MTKNKPTRTARRMKTRDMDELVSRLETLELASAPYSSADEAPAAAPFRFLALPFELRIRVYEHVLVFPRTIDLDPANTRTLARPLGLFLVSHAVHSEASRVFYSRNTFRIFPVHGRFFHTKRPLLARLPPTYRAHLTKLELRLGPGWTKPPKGWVVDSRLGLEDAPKVHMLKLFVECDPASSEVFEGFRHGEGEEFYTTFCVALLRGLFAGLPALSSVEFDAYPSVSRTSPLLKRLVSEASANQKTVRWGPERGWDKIVEVDLANVLQKMGLASR